MSSWLPNLFGSGGSKPDSSDPADPSSAASAAAAASGSSASSVVSASESLTRDQIREQRTAKLQKNLAASAPAAHAQPSAVRPSSAVPKAADPAPASPSPLCQPSRVVSSPSSGSSQSSPPPAKVSSPSSGSSSSSPMSFSSAVRAYFPSVGPSFVLNSSASPLERQQQWEDNAYAELLQVTFDKSKSSASRLFLSTCFNDGLELLNRDVLDSIFIERIQLPTPNHSSLVAYLLAAYKKAGDVQSSFRQSRSALLSSSHVPASLFPSRAADFDFCDGALDSLRTQIVTYLGLTLNDGVELNSPSAKDANMQDFVKLLLTDPSMGRSIPDGILEQLITNFEQEIGNIFNPVLDRLMGSPPIQPTGAVLFDDSKARLQAVANLARFPAVANLIVDHARFNPRSLDGMSFQNSCFFGSHLNRSVPLNDPDFLNAESDGFTAERTMQNYRAELSELHALSLAICKALMKSGKANLKKVVGFFTNALRLNAQRRRTHFNPMMVSGHPFLINLLAILLKLALPIVKQPKRHAPIRPGVAVDEKKDVAFHGYALEDRGYSKVRLEYLLAKRLDYDNVTKLFATQGDVNANRVKIAVPEEFNFNTECFFLTHECLHIALLPALKMMQETFKQFQEVTRNGDNGMPGNTRSDMIGRIMMYRTHLEDPALLSDLHTFYDWTALWMIWHLKMELTPHIIDAVLNAKPIARGQQSPFHPFSSARAHLLSSLIPEYFVEDILDYWQHLGSFGSPQLMDNLEPELLDGLCDLVVFFSSKEFLLRNPQLRGELAQVLLHLMPPDQLSDHPSAAHRTRAASQLFLSHPILAPNIVHSLLFLYIEVEYGERAYYYRFNFRHAISMLFEYLWQFREHRIKFAQAEEALFLRFMNMVANDLVFIMDEGLKHLTTIREVELLKDDPAQWNALTQQVRDDKEKALSEAQRGATGCLQLGTVTVEMLCYMSEEIKAPFVSPQFVERMANMLCYYVMKLAGPQTAELKVKNPQRYHFDPKTLLKGICGTILHLSDSKAFVESIAGDQRSYSHQSFVRALNVLKKFELLGERETRKFEALVEQLRETSDSLLALDEIVGEPPEEYLDELVGTLMLDPIMLPLTKNKMDRSNIQRHLMNQQTNPFSRAFLTEADLIELPELKEEIHKWVEERKEKWRENKRLEAEAAALAKEEDQRRETEEERTKRMSENEQFQQKEEKEKEANSSPAPAPAP